MLDEKFIYLAVVLTLYGYLSYLKGTLSGKVKPNKVTWFLWGLAPMIAFVAQLNQGVGLVSLLTFAVGFGPFVIFFASFINKKAQWKISSFDLICGAVSVVGLILWLFTKVGDIAIFFSILADALAAAPTILKSIKAPETESSVTYLMGVIGSIITLLTIKQWDFPHYGFSLYLLLMASTLFVIVKFKLGKKVN